MSASARKLRRAVVRRKAIESAKELGCTCPERNIELRRNNEMWWRTLHDDGCPAIGIRTLMILPPEKRCER
jgi:hypothetical protein